MVASLLGGNEMMWRGMPLGRTTRWLASWAAAYALVFQVVLTSAALAGLPRDGGLDVLCLNSATAAAPSDADGKTAPLGIHCPACLARIDLASLPPPIAAPQVAQTVVVVPFRPVLRASFRAAALRLPLQARAPPHSA